MIDFEVLSEDQITETLFNMYKEVEKKVSSGEEILRMISLYARNDGKLYFKLFNIEREIIDFIRAYAYEIALMGIKGNVLADDLFSRFKIYLNDKFNENNVVELKESYRLFIDKFPISKMEKIKKNRPKINE